MIHKTARHDPKSIIKKLGGGGVISSFIFLPAFPSNTNHIKQSSRQARGYRHKKSTKKCKGRKWERKKKKKKPPLNNVAPTRHLTRTLLLATNYSTNNPQASSYD